MTDRIGQQFGNYRLLNLLGKGGFAEVYLGEHIYLKTPAAIKLLQMKAVNQEDLEGFLNEARTIARLVHPHIVRILEFGLDGETPFLVMDYASGGTLRQRHPRGTLLPLTTIVSYAKQIAGALQYAHNEKLIHRDVKPENMLVGRHNAILLSDFGIAMIAQSSHYQSTQNVIGTVAYMAPEQIQGKSRPASDQYSLGIVVYEWLCGDRPFHGSFTELCTQHMFAAVPPLHEKIPVVPPAVEQVVSIALAKDPKQRFGNIEAFVKALEQASQSTYPPNIHSNIIAPKMPRLTEEVNPPSLPVQPTEIAVPPNQTYWPEEEAVSLNVQREVPVVGTSPSQSADQVSNPVVKPGSESRQHGVSRRTVIVSLAIVATAVASGSALWLTRSLGSSTNQHTTTLVGNTSTTTPSGSTPTTTLVGNTSTTTPSGNTPTTTLASKTNAVSITSSGAFAFSPATIAINVGTTVTWTNNTGAPHTVTSDDGTTFDSGINTPIAANGGTFSFTFTNAGTFAYHCQIHPFMKATVIVQ